MAEARQDEFDEAGPGTQPASFDDLDDGLHVDDAPDGHPGDLPAALRRRRDSTSVGTEDTEPHDHSTTA